MNDFIKTLIERRSIRKYKSEQITQEELNCVMQAGLHAPSAKNDQPVILIAVQQKEARDEVMKMNQKVIGNFESDPYYGAPTIILVLSKAESFSPKEDAALAIGNMYNAAFSLGLGSCWIHREAQMFASDEGKKFLEKHGIKGNYEGVGSLILGYPATEFMPVKEIKENREFYI